MDDQTSLKFDSSTPEQLYAIARLALWAGDLKYADALLKAILRDKPRLRRGEKNDFDADPIAFAARRLRSQISRRRSEYHRLLKASGLPEDELSENPTTIDSSQLNIRGVLWPRDDDQFTMLAFLTSANDEVQRGFFARAIRFGGGSESVEKSAATVAGYDVDVVEQDSQSKLESRPVAFSPSWKRTEGNLFLRIVVGDYATIEVNGVWTGNEQPGESDIVPELQKVLNSLDPAVEF